MAGIGAQQQVWYTLTRLGRRLFLHLYFISTCGWRWLWWIQFFNPRNKHPVCVYFSSTCILNLNNLNNLLSHYLKKKKKRSAKRSSFSMKACGPKRKRQDTKETALRWWSLERNGTLQSIQGWKLPRLTTVFSTPLRYLSKFIFTCFFSTTVWPNVYFPSISEEFLVLFYHNKM